MRSKNRPTRLVGVIGTGTEVGKTWATSRLLRALRARGVRVAARKPVQSFESGTGPTDAECLAEASGEPVHDVCPAARWYPLALAPPMAADLLGREQIKLNELVNEIIWPADVAIGFVETAGGVRSPVAHDGDSIDLIRRLDVDEFLLVADAKLGALNSVRLTLACTVPTPTTVLLNRYDDSALVHRLNREWLQAKYGVRILTSIDEWS